MSAAAKLADLPKSKQNEVIDSAKESGLPLKKVVAKAAKHVVPQVDSDWEASEIERRKIVENGGTVLANKRCDKHLLRWASEEGVLVPIDRGTPWGNPFIEGQDGDRDKVCNNYEWYLQRKPSLLNKIETLRGKVLACWCYPLRCHGDCIRKEIKDDR